MFQVIIYPNPVKDIMNINYNNDEFRSICILNSTGMILRKEPVRKGSQLIDLSPLPK